MVAGDCKDLTPEQRSKLGFSQPAPVINFTSSRSIILMHQCHVSKGDNLPSVLDSGISAGMCKVSKYGSLPWRTISLWTSFFGVSPFITLCIIITSSLIAVFRNLHWWVWTIEHIWILCSYLSLMTYLENIVFSDKINRFIDFCRLFLI